MSFSEWKTFKLEDVTQYSKNRIELVELNEFNYISTENMISEKGGVTVASSLPKVKSVTRYNKGDVLISNIRPYFKKIWYADKVGGTSNDVLVFHPSKLIDSKFLYYYLSQDSFFDYMTKTAKGTKMPRGDKQAIMGIDIQLPSLEEQKVIADILSSLDDKIELNNQMNETVEEMAQALFKRWFVDFEFPNEEGQPYKSNGGEMIESELGMIPHGWEVKGLGELIAISSGKRPSKKSSEKNSEYKYPLIGASSIMGYVLEPLCDDKILVIGRVGTHGVVQRFFEPVWPSDNTLVIRTPYYEFINQILRKIDYSAINRGSTQPLITQTDIKNTKVIFPTAGLLKTYEEKCSVIFNMFERNQVENISLCNLRDTLLPKLMSGEIQVSDLEG